jgi:hypothetical protein
MLCEEKKVDFLLVGAQKSGTTSLHAYLSEHPDISMAKKKEVHFFDTDENFFEKKPDYNHYHSFFDLDQQAGKIYGEATPSYMYCRNAPARIWQYNKNMKIIVILRNPVERAFSHWNMEVSRGAESLNFYDAITKEEERCRETLPAQHYVYSYVDRGFYMAQLKELWRCFGKNQVLVLNYDQFFSQPIEMLGLVFSFLQVDNIFSNINFDISCFCGKKLHKSNYNVAINIKEKNILQDLYRCDIQQLEAVLDWDCSAWLK